MLELAIVKLFLNSIYYNKYINSINRVSLEKETLKLINTIKEYYQSYPDHEYIDPQELQGYFFLQNPGISDAGHWKELFAQLRDLKISDSLAADMIRQLIERDVVNQIIQISLPVLENRTTGVLPEIDDILKKGREALCLHEDSEEDEFISDDLETLIEKEVASEGLNWRLGCLNEAIGPLRSTGMLVHIFARTDVGKTTFLLSEVSRFAEQLKEDECGLWFNNEGSQSKLRLRWFSAVLGRPQESVVSHYEKAKEYFEKLGGSKVKLMRTSTFSVYDVEEAIKKHRPKFVIIDVADKVKFIESQKARTDEKLQQLYQRYRELGLMYNCDIITVGQASADATGKKYLIEDWMNNSKTGKPGELDVAIGIGCTDKDSVKRYISLPKNKQNCNAPSKFVVRIDKACARYADLGA